MIKTENVKKPLSDQQIADHLKKEGLQVARRYGGELRADLHRRIGFQLGENVFDHHANLHAPGQPSINPWLRMKSASSPLDPTLNLRKIISIRTNQNINF